MTTRAKHRLFSILIWLVVVLTALISLAFIFSAQLFVERGQTSWANLMTVTGSGLLALVNLYIGARIQQNQDKSKEKRATRKSRTTCHRKFIDDIDSLVQQLKCIPSLERQHNLDEADRIRYDVQSKLEGLHNKIPSSAGIDKSYRKEIEDSILSMIEICGRLYEKLSQRNSSAWTPYLNDLKTLSDAALSGIDSYEEME